MLSSAAVFKLLFRLTAVCDIGTTAVDDFISKPQSHAAILSVACIGIFLLTELFELAEEFGHNENSKQRRVLAALLLAVMLVMGLSGAAGHRRVANQIATSREQDAQVASDPVCTSP